MIKPSEWTKDGVGVGSLLVFLYGALNFLMIHGFVNLAEWSILPALLVSAFWSVVSTLFFIKGLDLGQSDWIWAYPVGFSILLTAIWGPIVTLIYSEELADVWGLLLKEMSR